MYQQVNQYTLTMMEGNLLMCHCNDCLSHKIYVIFASNHHVDLRNVLMLLSYQLDKFFPYLVYGIYVFGFWVKIISSFLAAQSKYMFNN